MTENNIPFTNFVGDEYVDRIYQNVSGSLQLVLKNGEIYKSKIDKKSIKLDDGTLNYVFHADGKWFDRTGLPISKPKNLVTREQKDGE
jgi:hypothetical protein